MIIFDEDHPSDSPFVERIWRSHSEGTSALLSTAESRCELVVSRIEGKITMTMRGPETKATSQGEFSFEGEWVGIRLKPGVFFSHLPAENFTDTQVHLPEAGGLDDDPTFFEFPPLQVRLRNIGGLGQLAADLITKSRNLEEEFGALDDLAGALVGVTSVVDFAGAA